MLISEEQDIQQCHHDNESNHAFIGCSSTYCTAAGSLRRKQSVTYYTTLYCSQKKHRHFPMPPCKISAITPPVERLSLSNIVKINYQALANQMALTAHKFSTAAAATTNIISHE